MRPAINQTLERFIPFLHLSHATRASQSEGLSDTPWSQPKDRNLIVHCCYHKAGTHWMKGILKRIADQYELSWDRIEHSRLFGEESKTIKQSLLEKDILIDGHSRINLTDLPDYRGSHMVRDPRDMTISGYFYHLWAKEKWLHVPRSRYGEKTYQELLNSLNQEEGLGQEIERFAGSFQQMKNWDYDNPKIFELRYEQLLNDDGTIYRRLFEHYGFSPEAVDLGVTIANRSGFEARAKRKVGTVVEKAVMRSGKPGQWRDYFTQSLKKKFKEMAGDVLIELGYEKNNDW